MESMSGLVNEAKKNKFSGIGPLLSEEDVLSVWESVSNFVERQMSQQKGVHIQGLGTFTFSQKKLDVGNNKFILVQMPVFQLSEAVAQTHQLQYTKHHVTGKIPVVPLNYFCVSFESAYDRDSVELCVKQVLQALSRSIETKKSVEFTFQGIGRLHIKDGKVKMKFYKEFLNNMDGTGQAAKTKKNRPPSQESVLSCSEASSRCNILNVDETPTKICNLVLPKITPQPGDTGVANKVDENKAVSEVLPTILEDGGGDDDMKPHECDEGIVTACGEGTTDQTQGEKKKQFTECTQSECKAAQQFFLPPPTPPCFDTNRKTPASQQCSGLTGTMPIMGSPKLPAYSGGDMITPRIASPSKGVPLMKRSLTPIGIDRRPDTPLKQMSPPRKMLTCPSSSGHNTDCLNKPPPSPLATPPCKKNAGSRNCGHSDAGQELCYLCHQRNKKNVPVYYTEERRRQEAEMDRLMSQYQTMHDTEMFRKDLQNKMAKRHESQKIAAFNLGASEAQKYKRHARDTDFHSSYVFQNRPVTPPKYMKQEKYCKELNDQVSLKHERHRIRKTDEDILERLEQLQLAEDLAHQREEYLRNKAEETDSYKRALSAQILVRDSLKSSNSKLRGDKQMTPPTLPKPQIILPFSEMIAIKVLDGSKVVRYKQLPMCMPSAESVFGKNDMNPEKMMERRARAREVYQEQINTVENRKREAILNRIKTQKEEEATLDKCREELLKDRAERYERMYKTRRTLEHDWAKAMQSNMQRENEERMRFQSPAMLVHEQCDKYKRCSQCKRKVINCGESNIWRETRYIPGSRLMV